MSQLGPRFSLWEVLVLGFVFFLTFLDYCVFPSGLAVRIKAAAFLA